VIIRGVVHSPAAEGSVALVVSIMDRGEGVHQVEDCRVNDQRLVPRSALRYFTLVALHAETVFAMFSQFRDARNVVTCRITGRGREFDVDVYEIRG
jgi:hypothetical protein